MSKVYAVFQQAVYRHSCFGIFGTERQAKAVAEEIAQSDLDAHHYYTVVPFELDKQLPFEDHEYARYAVEEPSIATYRKRGYK
jgi:hypothetical protein